MGACPWKVDMGSGAVDGNSEGGDLNSFVATEEEEEDASLKKRAKKRVG